MPPRNRRVQPGNGRKPWIFDNSRVTHPQKPSIFGRPHSKNQQIKNPRQKGAQLDTAAILARKNRSAGVLAGGFGRRLAARLKPPLVSSQRDAAETRRRDGCATAAETALENAAFILARSLANHFKKNGDLDNLGKVDVTKTDIVRLRKQVLLDKATAILNLASAAVSDPAAAGRGVTAARIATLTAAIAAFGKVMNTPRGQIVNKSALLREVETDVAALVQLATDMDDLTLQFDGTDAGKRFIEAWKRARIIVDTGGGHGGTPPTPPTPPATSHP